MKFRWTRTGRRALALLLVGIASQALPAAKPAGDDDLLQISEQLDRQEFQDDIARANRCTSRRDFDCADAALRKAAKVASAPDMKKTLASARADLGQERAAEIREAIAARDRAEAERAEQARQQAEREEEEAAEERRQAQQQRDERARREAEEDDAPALQPASPFQGLDKINQIMRDGQKKIAEAQAARAEQQRQQRDQERRDREAQAKRDADARAQADDRRRQALADQRAAQEAAQRAEQQRREADAARREQVAQAERDRLQADRDRRDAERQRQQAERDRAAAQIATALKEQQDLNAGLEELRQGIRLVATKCPDGEGHYYATGVLPPHPKFDGCIDVSYTATCPGSVAQSRGVARNFIGMSGCFGDTYQIEPKPACKPDEVRIQVTAVTPGCKGN